VTKNVICHFVLALFLVSINTPYSTAQTNESDPQEAIEAVNSGRMEALRRGDAEGFAALYTDDALLLAPHHASFEGREEVAAYMQRAMNQGITEMDLETTELTPYGDAMVEIGEYALFAGDRRTDQGKYLVIWIQEEDSWKLHRDMMNTSVSQATVVRSPSAAPEKLEISGTAASSSWSDGYAANRAFDGSKSSYWSSERGDAEGAWIDLLLREPKTITEMRLFTAASASGAPLKEITLMFSDGSRQTKQLRGLLEWEDIELQPVTTESVRIIVDDQFSGRGGNRDWVNIHEVMLMGY